MATFLATFKAIITRIVFAAHGLVAIWQVTIFRKNFFYWYLCSPIILLCFEGIFTLTIKENQEWKWFCPSVFLYLGSIVPAIWLLELDKVERRMRAFEEMPLNFTNGSRLIDINSIIGVEIKIPDISLSTETWITLIEQFLMLILIIGRWMLPKGDLTRDQLSQLLLVYIGTAADIIEFFDSFKDEKISSEPVLVLLTLAIWSWSLMQFTIVLTATKSRKSRLTTTGPTINSSDNCCTIDVCGILLNITLQDFPFLAFRLLLITHYQIISYMNIFFTCKNTLVILLQIYRLYVVFSERHKIKPPDNFELSNISIISSLSRSDLTFEPRRRRPPSRGQVEKPRIPKKAVKRETELNDESSDSGGSGNESVPRKIGNARNARKDTGYSTASSQTSTRNNVDKSQSRRCNISNSSGSTVPESKRLVKQKLTRTDGDTQGRRRVEEAVSEESDSNCVEVETLKKQKAQPGRSKDRKYDRGSTVTGSDRSSD